MAAIDRVQPYERNPRRNERAVEKVKASLEEFGWRQPIVVDTNWTIVAGHTRWLAAKALGLVRVPVHVAADLTPQQVRAYRLADNRTHEDAEWVEELLAGELVALRENGYDLALTGFDKDELSGLLTTALGLEHADDFDPTPPAKPKSQPGRVYKLGPHRVVCGSSTDRGALSKVFGDDRARVLWTDPPYGVKYVGGTRAALTILNDQPDDTLSLLVDAFTAVQPFLEPSSPFYVASPAGPQGTRFRVALEHVGWRFHQALVWVKDRFVLGHSDHHYQHEDVLFGHTPGGEIPAFRNDRLDYDADHVELLYGYVPGEGRPGRGRHDGTRWIGGNNVSSVVEVPKPARNADHPTMKPVALICATMGNSAGLDDLVLDCFGGSGSTLIACEVMQRRAVLVELDARFVDVIRRRYAEFTNQPRLAP